MVNDSRQVYGNQMDELKQDNTRLKAELKKLNDDKNRLEEESKEQQKEYLGLLQDKEKELESIN